MLFVFDSVLVSLHDDRETVGLPDNDKGASPDLREQIAYNSLSNATREKVCVSKNDIEVSMVKANRKHTESTCCSVAARRPVCCWSN